MTQEQELDRKDLKIQALLEKVGSLATQYENQIADLRVEVTVVTQERDALRSSLDGNTEVVDAEVVEDVLEAPQTK